MASENGVYRKVYVKLWRYGGSFSRLSPLKPSGQALWLYLLTGDMTCQIPGVIQAGEMAICEALGWDTKAFREAFREVLREGLLEANTEARLMFCRKAMEYNPPTSPNVVIGWGKYYASLPDCDVKESIYLAIEESVKAFGKAFQEAFTKAFTKDFTEDLTKPVTVTVTVTEREKENTKEKDSKAVTPPSETSGGSPLQKEQDSIKPEKPKKKPARFTPPTVQEVTDYCKLKGYNFDPEAFCAFYESKGWVVGKAKMKSWKAACVTWQKRYAEKNPVPDPTVPIPLEERPCYIGGPLWDNLTVEMFEVFEEEATRRVASGEMETGGQNFMGWLRDNRVDWYNIDTGTRLAMEQIWEKIVEQYPDSESRLTFEEVDMLKEMAIERELGVVTA